MWPAHHHRLDWLAARFGFEHIVAPLEACGPLIKTKMRAFDNKLTTNLLNPDSSAAQAQRRKVGTGKRSIAPRPAVVGI